MLDGERKIVFQDIFVILCTKLEELKQKIDVPKMPIFDLKGPIIKDIYKAYNDEQTLNSWDKETSDFFC